MPAHQQSPRSLSKRHCTSDVTIHVQKGLSMGFIPQSEGIADVGQHKYGQYRNNIISTATGKAPSSPTELRLLAVVMTKVQLLSMHGIFRLKPDASWGWQSKLHVQRYFANPSDLAGLTSVNLLVYLAAAA